MGGPSSIAPRHRYRRVGTATAPLVIDVRPEDDVSADTATIAVAS